MKTTYLIYKQVEGTRKLVVATQEEWDAILDANKDAEEEDRRCFELNCIEEDGELDRLYIEVPKDEHSKWNSKNTVTQRNRKVGEEYLHLSLDGPAQDAEVDSLHEVVSSNYDLEQIASDHVLVEQLYEALKAWKPWAAELLSLYLDDKVRSCTSELCKKYHITYRGVQKRKVAFERFVLKFLEK